MKRKSTLAGLAFLMFMGIAVYFRLWAIDYNISIDDSELVRYVPLLFIFFCAVILYLPII